MNAACSFVPSPRDPFIPSWETPVLDPNDPNWRETQPEDPSEQIEDPENAMIALAAFNGMRVLVEALGSRGLLTRDVISELEESVLSPLDDVDIRDRMGVTAARGSFLDSLGVALANTKR